MITLPPAGIAKGRALIVRFEGRVLHPYLDNRPKHPVWTIGNGITTLMDGSPVGPHTPPLTPEESDALTDRKLGVEFVPAIERGLTYRLRVNQTAAILSLTWNIGVGAFLLSPIRHAINAALLHEAGTRFRDYCHEEGKLSPSLLKRRMAEMAVWDEPDEGWEAIAASTPAPAAALTTEELNAASLAAAEGERT